MPKLLFITTIYPPEIGGIEGCLQNIIKRLPKEKVVVLAQRQEGDQGFDQKQDYPIFRRRLENKYLKPRWVFSPLLAMKIALAEKVDCVQAAHGFGSYLAAWWLKRLFGIPYFVWAYGLDILAMQKSKHLSWGVRKIFKEAEGGIANSNFTKELMAKLGLAMNKIGVVYPGVEIEEFKPGLSPESIRKKYNIPQGKFILLSISRLVPRKGFDLVIRALPKILEKFPWTVYLIGGKGEDEPRLRAMVKKYNLQKAVQFLGFVEDRDLPFLYNLADVFLMPSRFIKKEGDVEGFGMVFLEAGACECPVIGGNSGGIPEAIINGKTGFLVNPESPKDLARKVIRLLEDEKLRKKMGEAGRKRASQEFNWERITKNFQFSISNIQ